MSQQHNQSLQRMPLCGTAEFNPLSGSTMGASILAGLRVE